MARQDLDELRLEIAALADEIDTPLTAKEFDNLWHYGEAALLGTLSAYEAVAEVEHEQREEEYEDEEERERREILADYGYEDFYPDYGWEIELVWDVDTG